MNAIPAEAQTDGQDQQQQEQGHLAVVGGRGRPSTEQVEAARKETETKLRALGMFDQAVEYAGKKGWGSSAKWNTKNCGKILAWAREQAGVTLCECGEPAHHYPEDGPALCDSCHERLEECSLRECEVCGEEGVIVVSGAMLCQGCADKHSGMEIVSMSSTPILVDPHVMDNALSFWAYPYEIASAMEIQALRDQLYWTQRRASNLRDQLDRAQDQLQRFNDIRRMAESEGYDASLDQLYIVMSIDNGKAVRDVAHGVQGIIFDGKRRNVVNYKGEVGAKLTITFNKDKLPQDCDVAIITCEVSQKVPAAVCGSRIGLDTSGKVLAPREFFQNLPLGQAGNE
ncbi:MAG: hypothetical protein FD177_257 [Desulfovibrionaceae bacterium]|nr:MAG: hypothetical protein FD177_257 [Desulfovibrionaceae bacterium]